MRKDYETLGIDENADEKTIKKAYFKLIRKHSPERDPERFQEIRVAYERLLEERNRPENEIKLEFPADDKLAVQMYDQIQELMTEQEFDRAALTAKKGMKYYHEVECFLYMYAKCSLLDGRSGRAAKAYEKLVKRYPDKLYYKGELAKAYLMRGYERKAYAMFREAYREGWRETDFLEQYGMCCFEQQNYDEADLIFQEMIASIPDEKIGENIPNILAAYGELMMCRISMSLPVGEIAGKCCEFLDRVGSDASDYMEQLLGLILLVHAENNVRGGDRETRQLEEKIKELLPESFDMDMEMEEDEFPDVTEAKKLLEDERFSQLMKLAAEAFLLEDTVYLDDWSYEYAEFMQMDMFLCQLEAWPRQRKELELLKKDYPALYEASTEIWEMLEMSRGNKGHMKDIVMADYARLERKYQDGHYFELYPEKRRKIGQVQWESQEEGTYVRKDKKIGRNEPCPCGSGKKYKNCCGRGV